MWTRRTTFSKNMNIVAFPCINFEFTTIKQKTLNKQGFTHKNAHYNWLICEVTLLKSHFSIGVLL